MAVSLRAPPKACTGHHSQGICGPKVTKNNELSYTQYYHEKSWSEVTTFRVLTFLSGPRWLSIVLYPSAEVIAGKRFVGMCAVKIQTLRTTKEQERESRRQTVRHFEFYALVPSSTKSFHGLKHRSSACRRCLDIIV